MIYFLLLGECCPTSFPGSLERGPSETSETSVMDRSVDTFEQNKRFLPASFRNWKKTFSVDNQTPLSPFSMLKCAPWTLSRGYNIEKGRGGRNVKIGDWKTHAFNETVFFSESISTSFVHDWSLADSSLWTSSVDLYVRRLLWCFFQRRSGWFSISG